MGTATVDPPEAPHGLDPHERRAIDDQLATVPTRRAACVEALKIVQRRRGWIDDDALTAVAAYLEMDVAELDNVASFYNLLHRRPVGRHVILVCTSVSCFIGGCDRLGHALSDHLHLPPGQSSERFTLLPMQCLGACDRAPALMIDEDLHAPVDPDRLGVLLEPYR